jgi:hypothetical protein
MVSPAMACLRVSIHAAPRGQDADALKDVVAKVINAFLQSRWEWPRLFEQMTPYAFVLTDPRAERMDKRGLTALASELQLKLFGAEGEGEVSLLLFEGVDIEVHRFARLSLADVERMLAGGLMEPPFAGLLGRIDPARPPEPELAAAADDFDDLAFESPPTRAPPIPHRNSALESVYGGLYLTMTQSFVGSLALCRRPRRDRQTFPDLGAAEPLTDLPAEAFDEGCVQSAIEALARDAPGLIAVPISFSSLVRPLGRRAYARFLCHLPAAHRDRLAAAIYDTPRAPTFSALQTIRRYLDPFFGEINLHVADPAFEVEKLPKGMVSSVTLALKDQAPSARMAAIRRFASARDIYKKKRIWPGVSPVVSAAELEACLSLKIPVIGGPAVAELLPRPPGVRGIALEDLPFGG